MKKCTKNQFYKFITVLLFLIISYNTQAQNVGIGTNNPDNSAKLEIADTARGLLIPRMTSLQRDSISNPAKGLMVFDNTTSSFWFYNGTAWSNLSNTNYNTLDQAYDQGGAGQGRTILADSGAVYISGEDGFLVTGTFGSGDTVISGTGTKMFFNPKKAAFRSGYVNLDEWDNNNVGLYSAALGHSSTASGGVSFASGYYNTAEGSVSTSFGHGTYSKGVNSLTSGFFTSAIGDNSISFGEHTIANGKSSMAFGKSVSSNGFASTVVGVYNDTIVAVENTISSISPLFIVGNGSFLNRSNAFVVRKNGKVEINDAYTLPTADGTASQVMTTDGSGNVSWATVSGGGGPIIHNTLDKSYDQGGAGIGRKIIASDSAVQINGTDGFYVSGVNGQGTKVEMSGAGTRMFFNPKKSAFRAGYVNGTQWDNDSIGDYSMALGSNSMAKGLYSFSLGNNNDVIGDYSGSIGDGNSSKGISSLTLNRGNKVLGNFSTAMGRGTINNRSYCLTIGAYNDPIKNFSSSQPSGSLLYKDDPLFIVGNGNYSFIGGTERKNAFVVNYGGAVGIGTNIPNTSAILEISDTARGILIPRLTTIKKTNIPAPAKGLLVFDSVLNSFSYFNGMVWQNIGNTLDKAYDQGGQGQGRIILADSGAVHISGEDGFLVSGTNGSGDTVISGAGTRMFFNPNKAAFRVGQVEDNFGNESTYWNNNNVGRWSFAAGWNTKASGSTSIALGELTIASGYNSTALGYASKASGRASTALGNNTEAASYFTTAMGNNTKANGYASTVLGEFNDTLVGIQAGTLNNTPLFIVGNGDAPALLSNAMAVNKRGVTDINGSLNVNGTNKTDGIYVSGTFGSGDSVHISGAGTRMFFNPKKAAFRAGEVSGTQWDNDSIGINSFATGFNTKAIGGISTAFGSETNASGLYSTALGRNTTASGIGATAIGEFTKSGGQSSFSSGYRATANGESSTAMGEYANATGKYAVSIGDSTTASGLSSVALGNKTIASGKNTTAFGKGSSAKGDNSFAIGYGCRTDSIFSFALGDSAIASGRKSMALGSNAKTTSHGAGAIAIGRDVEASSTSSIVIGIGSISSGPGSVAIGYGVSSRNTGSVALGIGSTAWADGSVALGFFNETFGSNSFASGEINVANGDASTVMGFQNKTDGYASTAFGSNNTALGDESLASGFLTDAKGWYSTTTNFGTKANGFASTVVGMFNDTLVSQQTEFNGGVQNNTPLFIVGNGDWGFGFNPDTLSNAFVVRKNGQVEINEAYILPTTDGNSGQIIKTDGVGNLYWANAGGGTGGGAVTLDGAYDEGGSGKGREIVATDSAVLISGTDGLYVTGTLNSGTAVEDTTNGSMMFFNPKKAAFRAGFAEYNSNGGSKIGLYSIGLGRGVEAKGQQSVALGSYTTASGYRSFAAGYYAQATGDISTAFGDQNTASGASSTVFGELNIASGYTSTALGSSNVAAGNYSLATGSATISNAENSSSFGQDTKANGWASTVVGINNDTMLYKQSFITSQTPLFIVGNGNIGVPNNAFTVFKNGKTRVQYDKTKYWDVHVDSFSDYNFSYNGTLKSYIQDTDGSYNMVSDRRLKKNIKPLSSSLQKILKLNPVTYFYKTDNENKKLQNGFIAQEVQKLYPELVNEKEINGEKYLTLRYDAFGVLAVKAIQEQQEKIDKLEEEKALQDKKIEELYQMVLKLKEQMTK